MNGSSRSGREATTRRATLRVVTALSAGALGTLALLLVQIPWSDPMALPVSLALFLPLGLLLAGPLVVLVVRSLRTSGGFGFDAYRGLGDEASSALFVAPVEAILNSLEFAAAATFIALLIGMMAATVIAYRSGPATRAFDAMLMLPLGTSAVTIGFGFLVALDAPIDLRTSI